MEQDEAAYPIDIGILRPDTIMFETDLLLQLLQEARLLRRSNVGGVHE